MKTLTNHKNCVEYFVKWLIINKFNVGKVKVLTILIFINIALFHDNPYSPFSYFFVKKMLSERSK